MNAKRFALGGFKISKTTLPVQGITVLQAIENNVYFADFNLSMAELQQKYAPGKNCAIKKYLRLCSFASLRESHRPKISRAKYSIKAFGRPVLG